MVKNPTRLKDIAESTRDAFMLDPRIIVVEQGFNARDFQLAENHEHIRELANSIKEIGVQNPVIVRWRDGKAVLVDGECRLRASLLAISEGADLKAIPALPEPRGVSEADRILSLAVRNGAKNLNALEFASVCSRLVALGWAPELIAKKMGCSLSKISRHLDFAEAPQELKKLVTDGVVSPTLAMTQIGTHGATKALRVLKKAEAKLEDGKTRVTSAAVRPPGVATRDTVKAMKDALKEIAATTTDAKAKQIAQTVLEAWS